MKRYLAFAMRDHEACGGWYDFEGDFDTIEEARSAAQAAFERPHVYRKDYAHIVDTETKAEVADGDRRGGWR